jgi:hypothetical protein
MQINTSQQPNSNTVPKDVSSANSKLLQFLQGRRSVGITQS